MAIDDGPPTLPLPVLLGLSPLFAGVSGESRDLLARFFHRVSLRQGQALMRQGEPAELLYLIASGSVEVVAEEGSRPVCLARLGPGEILGEVALNHPTTRNASVQVVEAGEAWAVPVAAFRGLALAGDAVATAVLAGLGRILCQRLRAVDQKIAALTEVEPVPPGRQPEAAVRTGPARSPDPAQVPLMRTLPVFARLEEQVPGALVRLLPYLRQWELAEGEELFREGMPGSSAFVVVRGAVEVAVARGLVQQRLALLGPGRLFGEVSLIDRAPRSATCTALQHTVVLELDQEHHAALLQREPAIAAQLITTMNRNLSANLASARRTLLQADPTAGLRPPGPAPEPDQSPVSGGALRGLRSAMSDHLRRVFGPVGPRTRVRADGGPGPELSLVDERVSDLLAWPAHRLRPVLEADLRERLGALPGDHLVPVAPGAPVAGLLELLELSVPAGLQSELGCGGRLPAAQRPALVHSARLPAAWQAAVDDSLAVSVPVPALHDGRPDPAALTAALLDHSHRGLRLVVLPLVDPLTGVALDVEGLTQLVHDSGGLVAWVGRSAAPPVRLRSTVAAAGREMADRDALLIDLSAWPGCGACPVLGVVGGHIPRQEGWAEVPLPVLARAWAWLEHLDQLGTEGLLQRQQRWTRDTVEAWRQVPGLRLVGSSEAPRCDTVVFRLRGREGSLAPALAQAVARDHWGVELGLSPDGSALTATVAWWLTEAELNHLRWAVVQLAQHGHQLGRDYTDAAAPQGAGGWRHRDAVVAGTLPERAPDQGSPEDWRSLQRASERARCG
jgi:CRP-like cAMP-binding protein